MLLRFGIQWISCVLIISRANTVHHGTHDSVRWNTDYPRYSDVWFLLIYMWASVPSRNFRGLLQSWWKHFPYIWQQWGREGGKDMVIPAPVTAQLWKYHLATKVLRQGKEEKEFMLLFWSFGFPSCFFLNPIQTLVRKDLCFPQALEVSRKEMLPKNREERWWFCRPTVFYSLSSVRVCLQQFFQIKYFLSVSLLRYRPVCWQTV